MRTKKIGWPGAHVKAVSEKETALASSIASIQKDEFSSLRQSHEDNRIENYRS